MNKQAWHKGEPSFDRVKKAAIKLVADHARPIQRVSGIPYPGEILDWTTASADEFFPEPNDLMGPSQIYWMTDEMFVHLLPILLLIPLIRPHSDLCNEVLKRTCEMNGKLTELLPSTYFQVVRDALALLKKVHPLPTTDQLEWRQLEEVALDFDHRPCEGEMIELVEKLLDAHTND